MSIFKRLTSALYRMAPPRVQHCITRTKALLRERLIDPKRFAKVQAEISVLEQQLRGKEQYRILFIVSVAAQWKQSSLFTALDESNLFVPSILLSPYSEKLTPIVLENYRHSLREMRSAGYTPIEALSKDGSLLDIHRQLSPDIIYYITPYDVLLPRPYRMATTYRHSLICYSRYGYVLDTRPEWHRISNLGYCWQVFLSSKVDEALYRKYSTFGGINAYATGPMIYDELKAAEARANPSTTNLPLVIIAPHHSIEPWGFALSNFLRLSDYLLTLPKRFAGRLLFAFKPHPHLRDKLYKHPDWGRERTDRYYEFWRNAPGCSLVTGPYADLFVRSSALLHDCAAFSVEYLLMGRPALFVRRKKQIPPKLNQIGQLAFTLQQLADTEEQIDIFLQQVARGEGQTDSTTQTELLSIALPNGTRSISSVIVERWIEKLSPKSI